MDLILAKSTKYVRSLPPPTFVVLLLTQAVAVAAVVDGYTWRRNTCGVTHSNIRAGATPARAPRLLALTAPPSRHTAPRISAFSLSHACSPDSGPVSIERAGLFEGDGDYAAG